MRQLGDEDSKGAAITGVSTKVKADITINTDVSYKKENATETNKEGRSFEGVSVTADVSTIKKSSSKDVEADSYGYLVVKVGNKEYSNGLNTPTGEYVRASGTSSTTAVVNIPSTAISSTKYLNTALIKIGSPNPAMLYAPTTKLSWNLQTRSFYRSSK